MLIINLLNQYHGKKESAPRTAKKTKPRRHGEHIDTQSVVNESYRLSELSEAISRIPLKQAIMSKLKGFVPLWQKKLFGVDSRNIQ
jgi:hypothetical protein